MKTSVFIHCANLYGVQKRIIQYLDKMMTSELLDIAEIYICFVGDQPKINHNCGDNVHIIHVSPNLQDYELPTLQYLYDYCCANQDHNILYLHTKNVGKTINECIEDQIEYMLYFNICKWRKCVDILSNNDCVTTGVDLLYQPVEHYSGNFWWARADYISKLPSPNAFNNLQLYPNLLNSLRHNQEFWICYAKNTGKHHCLWNSGINCYERHLHRYPPEKYID